MEDTAERELVPTDVADIIEGIEILTEELRELQDGDSLFERVENGCTAYQEEVISSFRDLGYRATAYHNPSADVNYLKRNTDSFKPRGHSVGFIVSPKSKRIVAFDATIGQSAAAENNEGYRVWMSDAPTIKEQVVDIGAQLHEIFGGAWPVDHISMGLVVNEG